ncbi:MAG: penicillin-binding protein 1C [Bacteroidia bacterium]|nr:penicillin-binding protein 1C [Bacteroidia bacterium]
MDRGRSTIKKWSLRILLVLGVSFLMLLIIPLPDCNPAYSTVLYSKDHQLLGARIAKDGQWRFPIPDSLPNNFTTCIELFEDEYFRYHPGVNPVSIFRAIRQNIEAGEIISGGSTITMQLARIIRGNRDRTVINKLVEIFISFQLEVKYSKEKILQLYAGLAPFGGNVVGLEAASWRYYARPVHLLSWSEAAALAVLPNAPSIIYPGKNSKDFELKRNRLLQKLYQKGILDATDLELAKMEALPGQPYALPNLSAHLLDHVQQNGFEGQIIHSTLDARIQEYHQEIAHRYHLRYHSNEIHNLAILVADVKTGEILSYVGNSDCSESGEGIAVDIIQSPRSSGSILKPLLYAAALDEGMISQNSLIPDIPTQISGYSPKNFDRTFRGAVKAGDALTQSLNIPAVRLLQSYGLTPFYNLLQKLEFSTIRKPSDHYGLSLILGGAEVTLFDLVNVYRGLANQLDKANDSGLQNTQGIRWGAFMKPTEAEKNLPVYSEGSVHTIMEVLSNVQRPRGEDGWQLFAGQRKIAWKTGTSFGHRDAWAIGMDAKHVVGVWVGNADGEGRPGLTGLNYAGPVMFDIFNSLGASRWFSEPYDALDDFDICAHSGYRIGRLCTDTTKVSGPLSYRELKVCDLHQMVNLDVNEEFRVNAACYSPSKISRKSFFQLPPTQSYFYRKFNAAYPQIPKYHEDCKPEVQSQLDIVYPFVGADIAIPRDFDGQKNEVVFSAAHSDPDAIVHWHLDGQFRQSTKGVHKISLIPPVGKHEILIVDERGLESIRNFEVIE